PSRTGAFAATLASVLALSLTACGGGGSSPTPPATGGGTSTPTPTTGTGACAITQQLEFADDVLDQWYLFPDLLDNTVQISGFSDVQSYLDARVAPARAQSIDRGFTFATSIAEENALINSGASAGFGVRLAFSGDRVFILEAFEAGNAFAAGIDRGTELLAIGTSANNLQTVASLIASGGAQAVSNALGPSDPGVVRTLQFAPAGGGTITADVTKSEFSLDPISDRYGALILNNGGTQVGYINLRTFIVGDASNQLRAAFEQFSAQGITDLVIDLRYNGGGLVRVADTFGDLLNSGRSGQVWSETVFRESQSQENSTRRIQTELSAIAPSRIAFIGRGGTASASELVINSMIPYLGDAELALVGANTFGKPVGQSGFDLPDCDLRVRATTFQTNNADGDGEYFTGLASVVPNFCPADDDILTPLGDAGEASIASALSFLSNGQCPSTAEPDKSAGASEAQRLPERQILQPERPNAAQYEIPGLF
ncbi:MAG: S41 family peptidase, partial [Pseudomonadota bacterium]|nr:S41 family peptidase [Pseudomonadota bacterium]